MKAISPCRSRLTAKVTRSVQIIKNKSMQVYCFKARGEKKKLHIIRNVGKIRVNIHQILPKGDTSETKFYLDDQENT